MTDIISKIFDELRKENEDTIKKVIEKETKEVEENSGKCSEKEKQQKIQKVSKDNEELEDKDNQEYNSIEQAIKYCILNDIDIKEYAKTNIMKSYISGYKQKNKIIVYDESAREFFMNEISKKYEKFSKKYKYIKKYGLDRIKKTLIIGEAIEKINKSYEKVKNPLLKQSYENIINILKEEQENILNKKETVLKDKNNSDEIISYVMQQELGTLKNKINSEFDKKINECKNDEKYEIQLKKYFFNANNYEKLGTMVDNSLYDVYGEENTLEKLAEKYIISQNIISQKNTTNINDLISALKDTKNPIKNQEGFNERIEKYIKYIKIEKIQKTISDKYETYDQLDDKGKEKFKEYIQLIADNGKVTINSYDENNIPTTQDLDITKESNLKKAYKEYSSDWIQTDAFQYYDENGNWNYKEDTYENLSQEDKEAFKKYIYDSEETSKNYTVKELNKLYNDKNIRNNFYKLYELYELYNNDQSQLVQQDQPQVQQTQQQVQQTQQESEQSQVQKQQEQKEIPVQDQKLEEQAKQQEQQEQQTQEQQPVQVQQTQQQNQQQVQDQSQSVEQDQQVQQTQDQPQVQAKQTQQEVQVEQNQQEQLVQQQEQKQQNQQESEQLQVQEQKQEEQKQQVQGQQDQKLEEQKIQDKKQQPVQQNQQKQQVNEQEQQKEQPQVQVEKQNQQEQNNQPQVQEQENQENQGQQQKEQQQSVQQAQQDLNNQQQDQHEQQEYEQQKEQQQVDQQTQQQTQEQPQTQQEVQDQQVQVKEQVQEQNQENQEQEQEDKLIGDSEEKKNKESENKNKVNEEKHDKEEQNDEIKPLFKQEQKEIPVQDQKLEEQAKQQEQQEQQTQEQQPVQVQQTQQESEQSQVQKQQEQPVQEQKIVEDNLIDDVEEIKEQVKQDKDKIIKQQKDDEIKPLFEQKQNFIKAMINKRNAVKSQERENVESIKNAYKEAYSTLISKVDDRISKLVDAKQTNTQEFKDLKAIKKEHDAILNNNNYEKIKNSIINFGNNFNKKYYYYQLDKDFETVDKNRKEAKGYLENIVKNSESVLSPKKEKVLETAKNLFNGILSEKEIQQTADNVIKVLKTSKTLNDFSKDANGYLNTPEKFIGGFAEVNNRILNKANGETNTVLKNDKNAQRLLGKMLLNHLTAVKNDVNFLYDKRNDLFNQETVNKLEYLKENLDTQLKNVSEAEVTQDLLSVFDNPNNSTLVDNVTKPEIFDNFNKNELSELAKYEKQPKELANHFTNLLLNKGIVSENNKKTVLDLLSKSFENTDKINSVLNNVKMASHTLDGKIRSGLKFFNENLSKLGQDELSDMLNDVNSSISADEKASLILEKLNKSSASKDIFKDFEKEKPELIKQFRQVFDDKIATERLIENINIDIENNKKISKNDLSDSLTTKEQLDYEIEEYKQKKNDETYAKVKELYGKYINESIENALAYLGYNDENVALQFIKDLDDVTNKLNHLKESDTSNTLKNIVPNDTQSKYIENTRNKINISLQNKIAEREKTEALTKELHSEEEKKNGEKQSIKIVGTKYKVTQVNIEQQEISNESNVSVNNNDTTRNSSDTNEIIQLDPDSTNVEQTRPGQNQGQQVDQQIQSKQQGQLQNQEIEHEQKNDVVVSKETSKHAAVDKPANNFFSISFSTLGANNKQYEHMITSENSAGIFKMFDNEGDSDEVKKNKVEFAEYLYSLQNEKLDNVNVFNTKTLSEKQKQEIESYTKLIQDNNNEDFNKKIEDIKNNKETTVADEIARLSKKAGIEFGGISMLTEDEKGKQHISICEFGDKEKRSDYSSYTELEFDNGDVLRIKDIDDPSLEGKEDVKTHAVNDGKLVVFKVTKDKDGKEIEEVIEDFDNSIYADVFDINYTDKVETIDMEKQQLDTLRQMKSNIDINTQSATQVSHQENLEEKRKRLSKETKFQYFDNK